MKYRIDENKDLQPGDELTFAYSGSGVATLVDLAGTGFKVAVGSHNLARIDGDKLVLAEYPPAPVAPPGDDFADAPPPEDPADLHALTAKELRALCAARKISLPKGNLTKAQLVGLLADED